MSKEDVINYVMTTPNNPNRAVLEGMLDEISGTQLPSPTESDNGKVLGVDNGEYKLVEQSGSGGSAVYELTVEEQGGGMLFTLHASYNDIIASNGGVAHTSIGGGNMYIPFLGWSDGDGYLVAVNFDGLKLDLESDNADTNLTYYKEPTT